METHQNIYTPTIEKSTSNMMGNICPQWNIQKLKKIRKKVDKHDTLQRHFWLSSEPKKSAAQYPLSWNKTDETLVLDIFNCVFIYHLNIGWRFKEETLWSSHHQTKKVLFIDVLVITHYYLNRNKTEKTLEIRKVNRIFCAWKNVVLICFSSGRTETCENGNLAVYWALLSLLLSQKNEYFFWGIVP